MPIEGKNRPTWADFGTRKGEIRPSQPQIRQKLFIPSKLHPWPLFQGSLPRGSFTESLAANILDWYPATIWLRGVELAGPEALPLLRPWRSGELASGLPGP